MAKLSRTNSSQRSGVMFEAMESRQMLSGTATLLTPRLTTGTDSFSTTSNSGSTQSQRSGDKAPLFDFKDSFYLQNGIDPTKIAGRRNGTGGSVVDHINDPTRRDVRVT